MPNPKPKMVPQTKLKMGQKFGKAISKPQQGIGRAGTSKARDLPEKAKTKGTPAMQARGRVGNKYPKGTKWGDDTRRGA